MPLLSYSNRLKARTGSAKILETETKCKSRTVGEWQPERGGGGRTGMQGTACRIRGKGGAGCEWDWKTGGNGWKKGGDLYGDKQVIAQVLKIHRRLRLWGTIKKIWVCYHSLSQADYHLSSAVSKYPRCWPERALTDLGLANNPKHGARFLISLLVLSLLHWIHWQTSVLCI